MYLKEKPFFFEKWKMEKRDEKHESVVTLKWAISNFLVDFGRAPDDQQLLVIEVSGVLESQGVCFPGDSAPVVCQLVSDDVDIDTLLNDRV